MSEFPRNNSEFVEEQGYDLGDDYYDGDSDCFEEYGDGAEESANHGYMRTTNITYTQAGAYFDDEVRIDLVIHEGGSEEIVLIIPGIDGSVDGYENKYLKMTEGIRRKNGATVIRMSNPHNLAGIALSV